MIYINSQKTLADIVKKIRGTPRIAIDTEFIREHQYYSQLEIIQISTDELEAIIDYQAIGTLEPFTAILQSPETLKVFHAAKQDLEICFHLTKQVPKPIFDTQVAAAMIGLGAQVGYSRLVEQVLDVSLAKSETLTDWSRRPLSQAQVEYALDDVRYLLPLHEFLQQKLDDMGRTAWLAEEWANMANDDNYRRVDPREAFRRVKGANRLRTRELAVLREVTAWREEEAMRRDRVPTFIARDHVLIELARRKPTTTRHLNDIRSLHPQEIRRQGKQILKAVRRGCDLPREHCPKLYRRKSLTGEQNSLVALMQAWLRARSETLDIATQHLSTTAELRNLVLSSPEERKRLDVLCGWRRKLIGQDLLSLLNGESTLLWNPTKECLQLIDRKEG